MKENGNAIANPLSPANLGRPSKTGLVDMYGKTINLNEGSSGRKDPFEENRLAAFKRFFAKYGPDLALIFLIVASGGATLYNAHGAYLIAPYWGAVLAAIVAGAGLVVECGYAWSWVKRGSLDLVGAMIKTNDSINKWSRGAMYLDIVLTVSTLVFALSDFGIYWMIFGQPLVALRIVYFWYVLKGQHPETLADQAEITLKARARADVILDAIEEMKLNLLERQHKRELACGKMRVAHEAEMRRLWSAWYRRRMKRNAYASFSSDLPEGARRSIIGQRVNFRALLPAKFQRKEGKELGK